MPNRQHDLIQVDEFNLVSFIFVPVGVFNLDFIHSYHPGEPSLYVHVTGRNAAPVDRGFHPTSNSSTGWYKVSPAVPLLPAVPFCTMDSAGMKPPLGGVSSVTVCPASRRQPQEPDPQRRGAVQAYFVRPLEPPIPIPR